MQNKISSAENRHSEARSSTTANILLFVVVLVIGLAAIEMMLRIRHMAMDNYDIEMWKYANELKVISENPTLGHEHRPSSKAVLQKVEIRINSLGMRGGEVGNAKKGVRRILFLGSSLTLGWGVLEEETTTMVLQGLFDENGQSVEVLNAGIGNYNTVRQVELFISRLTALRPTDIVVQFFVNDAEQLAAGSNNIILRNSQLAVMGWIVTNRLLNPGGEDALVNHYHAVYDENASGYLAMLQALKRLKVYAGQNNIRLHLALVPDLHNLVRYPFGFIHHRMADEGRKQGYNVVDLLPVMQDIPREDIWVMPGDPHANGFGHRIMAQAIYEAIR
jgi:hypothetical protein